MLVSKSVRRGALSMRTTLAPLPWTSVSTESPFRVCRDVGMSLFYSPATAVVVPAVLLVVPRPSRYQ